MTVLALIAVVFSWFYQCVGTLLGVRVLSRRSFDRSVGMPPISVLKPVSGLEPEMEANLESFFQFDYPDYEILICSERIDDPALDIARCLQLKFPGIPSRIIPEGSALGSNPKINTVGKAYDLARHDWVLISDANVRPGPGLLLELAHGIANGSDMQSGVLKGIKAKNQAGRIEALCYELYFARAMWLFEAVGSPCASAKCLFFRRSDALAFGGLKAISDYHADDVRLGQLILNQGKHVNLVDGSIPVYIGAPQWKSVWGRQIRWAKNRKVLFLTGFLIEPLLSPIVTGALMAWALSNLTGTAPASILACHLTAWLATDLYLLSRQGVPLGVSTLLDWLLLETFRMMVWLASVFGRQVSWRGNQYQLAPGGKMFPQKVATP